MENKSVYKKVLKINELICLAFEPTFLFFFWITISQDARAKSKISPAHINKEFLFDHVHGSSQKAYFQKRTDLYFYTFPPLTKT